MKKNALGRGLDALFPQADYAGSLRDIKVTDIDLNPAQPRQEFDQQALEQLADSIREVGVLQPLLVQEENGRYRIIAGERRFRAARLAGLKTVPCIQKNLDEQEAMLAALVENLQREDLNPIDEASAIQAYMRTGGFTQEETAAKLGKSRPAVANALRLLHLPEMVRQMVAQGQLSQGHARALAGLTSSAMQQQLALRVAHEGLSVRALEDLIKRQQAAPRARRPSPLAPELRDLQERLHRATGVRTQVRGDLQRGSVSFTYRTQQELQSLYEALEGIL